MTSAPDRMVVWLRETLDAAWQIAQAARQGGEGHWHPLGDQHGGSVAGDHEGYHVACDEGYPTLEQARHIALNDPAAVLRRITADRKLLDLHQTPGRVYDRPEGPARETAICRVCRYQEPMSEEPCTTVRLLAEGYGWTEGE